MARKHDLRMLALILAANFGLLRQMTCATELEVRRDIEYARNGGEVQALDVHLQKGEGLHPCIVYVHGGGFVTGDKGSLQMDYLSPFIDEGFSVISLNYRLGAKNPFPAPIEDVHDAIAFIKSHAGEYRVDKNRRVFLGKSAGGLIVGHAGAKAPKGSEVAAVLPFYGEHDLVLRASEEPCAVAGRFIPRPAGGCISGGLAAFLDFAEVKPETMPKLRSASAAYQVHSGRPPYLLIHGTRDYGVPFEQSVRMKEAVENIGVEAELIAVVVGGHGGWNSPEMRHYKPKMVA